METIKSILVIILLSLMIIFVISIIVDSIRTELRNKKLDKKLEIAFDEFIKKIEKAKVEVKETKTEPTTDYSSENILTLKKMAKEKGIKGYYNMKKDELVKSSKQIEDDKSSFFYAFTLTSHHKYDIIILIIRRMKNE